MAAAAAWLTSGGVAQAQATCASQATADGLEERGNALRLQQSDREALALFRQSYELCHGARARLRIGLAEAALGQWVEAEREVTDALAQRADPWIAANRAGAEVQLATIARHVGSLELSGEGSAAEVWVGNQPIGAWPMTHPVRVLAGAVVFSVRAPGHMVITRTVDVPPGGLAREHIDLVRLPTDATTTPSAATASGAAATLPVGAGRGQAPTASSESGSTQRTLGWAAAVGAGVGLAAGVVGLVVREGAATDFNTHCVVNGGFATQRNHPGQGDCQSLYDSGSTMQTVAIGGFVAGGVLAGISTVLLLTAPRRREQPAAAFACGQGPGTFGVACVARF